MIVQQQPLPSNTSATSPFSREYLAAQLSCINAHTTIQVDANQNQSFLNTFKSKLDLNWPHRPVVIPDTNTFYFVQFAQPFISIFNILPQPQKYNIILNGVTPLAVHVSSKIVYILLLGGRLLIFELGSRQVESQYINELQNAGCIYSMQTILGEDKKQSLRVAYESGGLKFFQLHTSFSFISNLVTSLLGNNNYKHIIPVSPNNLIGFVITNENQLKLINLYTKQLMDCDPINLQGNVNIHLLNLRFATRVPTLRKRGYITFFMSLYETNGSYFKLFKVQIKLNAQQIPDNKLLDLDDFINGNVGTTVTIKTILILNEEKQIQDIVMTEQGIYVCHKPHHNSPILKTTFRKYNAILISHPVQMLQSQIFKAFKDDTKLIDADDLRNKVTVSSRFTIPFLNNNGLLSKDLYTKLMGMSSNDIKILLNRLSTARWPVAYKFISIINIQGILFVVREQSISLLVRNSYGLQQFQKIYYEQQVKPFQKTTSGFQQQNEKSVISRFSVVQNKPVIKLQLPTSIEYLDFTSVESKLQRYSTNVQTKSSRYVKLLSALKSLFNYTSKYNQILYQHNLSMPNQIIRNVVLSQVRHTIRVISTLLIRLYPYSVNDVTYNDTNLIQTIFTLNKAINSPFKLFQSYFVDLTPGQYLSYDILTLLIMNEGRQVQKSFSFGSFEDCDYLKILGLLIGNDLELNGDIGEPNNLISFNGSNELLKFIVKEAEKNPTIRFYNQIFTHSKPKFITEYQLKAYLIAQNIETFSSKALSLAILPQFSCKFLKGLFQNDAIYRKGRAILQYLNGITQQPKSSSENIQKFISNDYKSVVEMLLGKCQQADLIENLKDQLKYLDEMNPRNMLAEFLQKRRLSQLIDNIRQTKSPEKLSLLLLQVFKKQCQLFNILKQSSIQANYVRDFIRKMCSTLRQSVEQHQIQHNILGQQYNQVEKNYLKDFEVFIYGRIPSLSLLYLIQTASNEFNQHKIINYEDIPQYYIKSILKGAKDQIAISIRKLLNYFTEDIVIKALVSNTSTSNFLKEKDVTQAVGNYGALNYYQMMGNNQLFKTVLNIIKTQSKNQNRNIEKQINAI